MAINDQDRFTGPRLKDTLKRRLRLHAGADWFAPLVGLFAGMDAFVLVIPIEALLVPSILLHPKTWRRSALWVAFGSALGAAALAWTMSVNGQQYLLEHFPKMMSSAEWARSDRFVGKYGLFALAFIAGSPIPQQPAAALAGLSHLPVLGVFAAVFLGRGVKYLFICGLASFFPERFLRKHITETKR